MGKRNKMKDNGGDTARTDKTGRNRNGKSGKKGRNNDQQGTIIGEDRRTK